MCCVSVSVNALDTGADVVDAGGDVVVTIVTIWLMLVVSAVDVWIL